MPAANLAASAKYTRQTSRADPRGAAFTTSNPTCGSIKEPFEDMQREFLADGILTYKTR